MGEFIGHYEVISELGRGGMGVVYKAHEQSLNRFVALKVLGEHLGDDPSYVQRFLREARSAAALNHPNIVQIYAVDEFEGKHYFAMEFVKGKSVLEMIRAEGKLDPVLAARLCLQAASGLAAAHEKGIIHRDIKPANLMVDERGLLKITDFGLALLSSGASRLTATGMFMGTPGYLSPEQCRDEDIDQRTDIYSLGVTFFEMLTGSIPFKADSPLALLRQILEVEPPDVLQLNPAVPSELRSVVKKMMEKDPGQRYGSAEEVAHELQLWLEKRGAPSAGSAIPGLVVGSSVPAEGIVANGDSPTIQVPSGAARAASQERTENLQPPSIPVPVIEPPAPPAAVPPPKLSPRARENNPPPVVPAQPEARARAVGFSPPAAAAPAIAAPPQFSPAAPATGSTSSSGHAQKKLSPIIPILAVVLLLLVGGALAAWKAGFLESVVHRFSDTPGKAVAASTVERETTLPQGIRENENAVSEESLNGISEESVPSGAPSVEEPGGAGGVEASAAGISAHTSEPEASGASSGEASSRSPEGNSLPSKQGGGVGFSSGTKEGTAEGNPGSLRNHTTPGGAPPEGTGDPHEAGTAAAAQAVGNNAPPEAPVVMGHGLGLVVLGDQLLAGYTESILQEAFTRRGLDVFNAAGIPGLMNELEGGGSQLWDILRPNARWFVIAHCEYLGERPLEYMGRFELEYQGRVVVEAFDCVDGRRIGQQIRVDLGFTQLNVERKLSEALRSPLRPIARHMGDIGNRY